SASTAWSSSIALGKRSPIVGASCRRVAIERSCLQAPSRRAPLERPGEGHGLGRTEAKGPQGHHFGRKPREPFGGGARRTHRVFGAGDGAGASRACRKESPRGGGGGDLQAVIAWPRDPLARSLNCWTDRAHRRSRRLARDIASEPPSGAHEQPFAPGGPPDR